MATETTTPTAGAPEPEPSLRDEIDAAFTEHATDETQGAEPAPGRTRDDHGRFAPEPKAPAAPAAPNQAVPAATAAPIPAAPRPGAPAPAPELKAPASWTPAAREKWASVDPELRAEIHRREAEGERVLREGASLRQFAQAFQEIVRPYEMFIRSENSDPLAAVQNLMNTAGQLRIGTPQTKVDIVTNIIRQHGIDLQMLDTALARAYGVAQPGQAPQQAPQQLHDPRVDEILHQVQYQNWQAQQRAQQQEVWETNAIKEGLATFASTHEFYNDVAQDMAELVDAATRRGRQVDLEKIYTRACQLNEQVSTILAQRGTASSGRPTGRSAGAGPSQAVLRARRAAVSVSGEPNLPEGSTVPKNDSIRGAIEAAIDAHAQ